MENMQVFSLPVPGISNSNFEKNSGEHIGSPLLDFEFPVLYYIG